MKNPFVRVTSDGGYLGRFYWCNSGSMVASEGWGSVHVLRDCKNTQPDSGWAGAISIFRLLF
jgi:hypothetical protein